MLSGNVWPIHLKPKPDELLSSWIVRLTLAHGLRLNTFSSIAWPKKSIWNCDVDRCADETITNTISEKTATNILQVKSTLITDYKGRLFREHFRQSEQAWILPFKQYHRKHLFPGIMYCPCCLQNDEEPYFRKLWRVSLFVGCLKHKKLLLNRCPSCQEPINFHLINFDFDQITNCYYCGFNIINASRFQKTLPTEIFQFLTKQHKALIEGKIHFGGSGLVDSISYFQVVWQILKILITGQRSLKFQQTLSELSSLNIIPPSTPTVWAFDHLKLADKLRYIEQLCWILKFWPDRLISVANNARLYPSWLLKDFKEQPKWFVEIANQIQYSFSQE